MKHENQRGYSLLELLTGFALLALLGGVAIGIFASARRAHDQAIPEMDRVARRSAIVAEIGSNARATASLIHFDLGATIAPLLPASHETSSSVAPSASLSKGVDGSGDPPGGGGGKPPDPPSGGGGETVPPLPLGDVTLSAVEGFGTGIVVGDRPIIGPLAVWNEPVWNGQEGPAVATLRTDHNSRGLHLAETFISSSRVITLASGDAEDTSAIAALRSGDLLLVNGSNTDHHPVTAIAELTEPPVETTPQTAGAPTNIRTFRASVSASDGTFRWGIRNASTSRDGVEILADATVALLDREGAVAVYVTARGESRKQSPLALLRIVGDPNLRPEPERLLDETAGPLEATVTAPSSAGEGAVGAGDKTGESASGPPVVVTIGVPMLVPGHGIDTEPIHIALASPVANRPAGVTLSLWNLDPGSGGGGN